MPPPSLAVEFCGLKLASPIVLLSGCVGFGEEYTRVEGFSNRDVGAIVLKGTTREPRLGNPAHRVYETPMGMLNAIGLQNPGRRSRRRPHPADARFQRDALLRQRLRLDDRGLRRGHAPLRRFADRRDRDQHLLPEHQGRRRAVRQLPGHVGARRRSVPQGHAETARSPSSRRTRPTSARTRAVASRPAATRSR